MADSIQKPYTFSNGTKADASEVNANFDTVYNQVNKIGQAINIDNFNNVGIGTTTPDEKLEVNGTVKATAFEGDGSALTGISSAGGNGLWTEDGNTGDIFRNTGNVGIGTDTPDSKLVVSDGDIRVTNGTFLGTWDSREITDLMAWSACAGRVPLHKYFGVYKVAGTNSCTDFCANINNSNAKAAAGFSRAMKFVYDPDHCHETNTGYCCCYCTNCDVYTDSVADQ